MKLDRYYIDKDYEELGIERAAFSRHVQTRAALWQLKFNKTSQNCVDRTIDKTVMRLSILGLPARLAAARPPCIKHLLEGKRMRPISTSLYNAISYDLTTRARLGKIALAEISVGEIAEVKAVPYRGDIAALELLTIHHIASETNNFSRFAGFDLPAPKHMPRLSGMATPR